MKEHLLDWMAILLALVFSVVYWSGIPAVPFHPDESSQIFMSSDVELFFQQPASLAWRPGSSGDERQQYRLLDAPLTRDLVGMGRIVAGAPALKADWNWSMTWDQNSAAGALPDDSLLLVSRFSVAWLFPFSLVFIYLTGKKLAGREVGFFALILLASSALVLLHTRRAMAESALLFTVILAIWSMVSFQKHPWISAVPMALAFAAKQSTAGLILVGIIVVILRALPGGISQAAKHLAYYLALFLILTILLNPFIWADPLGAVSAAVSARQDLLQRQVAEYSQLIPGQVFTTFPERILGMISNLFFTPLQFAETGNYAAQTQAAVTAYLANPLQNLWRSILGGGILLFVSLVGIIAAVVTFRKQKPETQLNLGIMILSTLAICLGLLLTIPLAFQRYVMPAVPFTLFWTAYAVGRLIWRLIVWSLKGAQHLFQHLFNDAYFPHI